MCCSLLVHNTECLFFFKQETAYEMRISDWSSDVCSSDLPAVHDAAGAAEITHDGIADGRFAAAAFTDQADGFAGIQLEVETRHHVDLAGAGKTTTLRDRKSVV